MLTTHSTQCMFNIPKSLAQQTVNSLLHEKRNVMPLVKSAGSNDSLDLLQKQAFTPFGIKESKGLFPKAGEVCLIGNEEVLNAPKKNHAESKRMNQACELVQTLQTPKKQEGKRKTGKGIPQTKLFFQYNNKSYETKPDEIKCTNEILCDGRRSFKVEIREALICNIVYKPYISPFVLTYGDEEDEFDFFVHLSNLLANEDAIFKFMKGMDNLRKYYS